MSTAKADKLIQIALEMNKALPTEVWLRGNGEMWVREHGNKNVYGRPATKEEIITYLYTAIDYGNKMLSVNAPSK